MNEKHIKLQMAKFSLYGLFKNLKFFEFFLWVYLYQNGLDIAYIGILIAIKEVIIYLFEVPSGVIADMFGKKNELILCFLFYISSFVLFYIGGAFYIFVIGFILYGFGEAFRSGTHKAMIMEFLDYHNIQDEKSKVYGLTRSFSMIGSTISSLLGAIFIIFGPDLRLLFLLSIIPYVIDLLLIMSYPNYLNLEKKVEISFTDFLKGISVVIVYTLKLKEIRSTLIDSAMYNAIFKSIKDYIQPIIISFTMGIILVDRISQDDNNLVILALIYSGIYLISAVTSKNSYKVLSFGGKDTMLYFVWALISIVFVLQGLFVDLWYVTIVLFVLIYVLQNIRKPLMVQKIGEITEKNKRASVLSVESQITSLFIIVMAPLLGFVYDHFGAQYIFYILAMVSIIFFVYQRGVTLKKDE